MQLRSWLGKGSLALIDQGLVAGSGECCRSFSPAGWFRPTMASMPWGSRSEAQPERLWLSISTMLVHSQTMASKAPEPPPREIGVSHARQHALASGTRQLRESISCALGLPFADVWLRRSKKSPGGRSIWCWGEARDKRFFAKVLRADPYPVVFKMAVGWESGARSSPPIRPLDEQVRIEWDTTERLRSLTDFVPAPLGRSEAAKTIVWEEVWGAWAIRLVRWSRWLDPRGEASAEALFEAGAWLRRVHDASGSGTETMDAGGILEHAREMIAKANLAGSPYGVPALRFLEVAASVGNTLVAPRALSHGDFTLANLLWNRDSHRLTVIDFENFAERSVCHDLLTMVFDLRVQLLNPLVKRSLILSLEARFWEGYGPVAKEIRTFIGALASSYIFYESLPRMRTRRAKRGWLPGATTRFYKAVFESSMVRRFPSSAG